MTSSNQNRIIEIKLDEKSLVKYNSLIEKERQAAIETIINSGFFRPIGEFQGPFKLFIARTENLIAIDITDKNDNPLISVPLYLASLRSLIKDYFTVCETYFKNTQNISCCQLEAFDMGRRSLHNEGAEIVKEKLKDIIDLDKETARALFTLICILHLRVF